MSGADLMDKLREAVAATEEDPRDAEIRALKRALAKKQRGEDVILAAVQQALEGGWRIDKPNRPKPDKRELGEEEHVLLIGDTQIGKVTPTYDLVTAQARVMQAVERASSIVRVRRKAALCESVVICLMGDAVEGENIFPGQPWEVQTGVYEQAAKWAPEIHASAIRAACEVWPRVRVRAVCGNHGRVDWASNPKTNWDRVAYHVTSLLLKGVVDDFLIAESFSHVERLIGGWGLMLTHGDTIQGMGTSGTFENAVKNWQNVLLEESPFTYAAIGHFHRAGLYPVHRMHLVVNGSTESPDSAYVRGKIKAGGYPSQTLLAFDAEHGLIGHHLLYLDRRTPR